MGFSVINLVDATAIQWWQQWRCGLPLLEVRSLQKQKTAKTRRRGGFSNRCNSDKA
jgi:hypothetical protein